MTIILTLHSLQWKGPIHLWSAQEISSQVEYSFIQVFIHSFIHSTQALTLHPTLPNLVLGACDIKMIKMWSWPSRGRVQWQEAVGKQHKGINNLKVRSYRIPEKGS